MSGLAARTCAPCSGDVPALEGTELEALRQQIPDWEVVEGHHLKRKFSFRNFREALDFVNRVGEIAEEQGHHPDVAFGWGYAEVTVFTHKIDGLTQNDFILAAKVDEL
jgi:4a-hydroxytetrahydrobiopterin dehydratase